MLKREIVAHSLGIIAGIFAIELISELLIQPALPQMGKVTGAVLQGILLSLVVTPVIVRVLVRQRAIPDRANELTLLWAAVEQLPVTVVLTDANGHIEYVNPAFTKITGYLPEEAFHSTPRLLKSGVQDEEFYRGLWGSIRSGRDWRGEVVNRRKDGTLYVQELVIQPVRDAQGQIANFVGIGQDVTERRQTQEALELAQLSMDQATDMILWVNSDGRFTYANASAVRGTGYPLDELLTLSVWELTDAVPRESWRSTWEGVRQTGSLRMEGSVRRKDGSALPGEVVVTHLNLGRREFQCAIFRDLTERQRSEEALRESEARHRALLRGVPDAIFLLDSSGVFLDYHLAQFGQSPEPRERFLGRQLTEVLPPNVAARFQAAMTEAQRSGATQEFEYSLVIDADTRHFEARVVPMEGATLTVVSRDITSRRTLETQLRQAQKMEAVGQLTGGIAHDFNNILMAVVGYTDFLLAAIKGSPQLVEDVREIRKAADRATVLIRQLLAFSRRQVLVPQLLDLNAVISEFGKMLKRLIGEDVSLALHLADDLGTVRADPGQLEQVLMNLALNARDAMPTGGTLDIGTANVDLDQSYVQTHPYVPAGRYVALWVSDSGSGMSKETISHLFEPFFTTKGIGKGTGLGLATVYGIVKQSGGHISVYSEPDQGSSFKIYLPMVEEAAQSIPAAIPVAPTGGQETILVADDDDSVRALVRRVLADQGYTVLAASSPATALQAAREHVGRIDLLVTDVVMPGQSGRQLADELTAVLPGLRVLYMSGYTHDAIVHRGILDAGLHYLSKPVTAEVLLRTVRNLLDSPADAES